MKKYSFSQLQRYQKCPYQYKLIYIDKMQPQGSPSMSFGISIHTTLQAFFNKVISLNGPAQSSLFSEKDSIKTVSSNIIVPEKTYLLELFEKKFIDSWYTDKKEITQIKQKGLDILSNYYDKQMGKWPTPLATEAGFTISIDNTLLKGKMDRIDQSEKGLVIVDYKSGKRPKVLSESAKQQLYVYQIAATQLPQFNHYGKVKKLTYQYLTSGDSYTFIANDEELAMFKQEIKGITQAIQKEEFLPTPSLSVCRRCPVQRDCSYSAPL